MTGAAKRSAFVGAGPKRNRQVHDAIIEATIKTVREVGYGRLTIEGVARTAGVGKATVYRWWQSKGDLVAEALVTRMDVNPVPDLGNTREELITGLAGTLRNYGRSVDGLQVTALATDLSTDPVLIEAFRRRFLKPRRAEISQVLQRGIDRGDLSPDIDDGLIQDIFAGTIFYRRLMSGLPLDESLVVELVDIVLTVYAPRHT